MQFFGNEKNLAQWLISPTFYEQLLHTKIPKAQKDGQIKHLFVLLGSDCVKAVRKHVDEINPRPQYLRLRVLMEPSQMI